MHIIAGEFRRRKIATPKGQTTRPTSSRLRESVFNICQNCIEQSSFLDLCAGSGAMGLEALSRGASFCVFVDNNLNALHAISENIEAFGIKKQTKVIYKEAIAALKLLVQEKFVFDLCYIDPPYHDQELFAEILTFLDQHPELFSKEATLFIESGLNSIVEETKLTHYRLESKRTVSDSILYTFTANKAQDLQCKIL